MGDGEARASRRPLLALLGANALSLVGNVLTAVAVPWFVLETTGSAARTGITAAVIVLPTIIAGVFGGALVDRLGFRRMSVVSDVASGVTVALIPTLHWWVGIEFWQLLALMFLSALLDVPGGTARQSMIPELAEAAGMRLERANSVYSTITRGAELGGPLLAGLLISQIGASAVLWVDAATFAVSAATIALATPALAPAVRRQQQTGYLREVLEGFRALRADRLVLWLVTVAALLNFVSNPLMGVVLPVYANERFGSAANLGLMLGGLAGGMLAGAALYGLLSDRLPRRAVFVGGFLGAAVPFGLLATLPGMVVTTAALVALGVAVGPLGPIFITIVQKRTPRDVRGRVFGLISASVWVVLPLGMLIAGYLLERFGLRATLTVEATAFLLLAGAVLLTPALRRMDEAAAVAE